MTIFALQTVHAFTSLILFKFSPFTIVHCKCSVYAGTPGKANEINDVNG